MNDIREFQLAELNVDQDNFRLGRFDDQRSCLQAMVRRQRDKLVELATDILAVGLSPGEPLWVAPDPRAPGRYVVLEGNRRVTALKVMDNPALAAGTDFEAAFRRLHTDFSKNPRRTVRATLFESVEAAAPWVERRHTNEQSGVGIQWWDPFAQDRAAKAKGRVRNRSMVLLERLSPTGDPEPLAVTMGLDGRTSTVDRVLNTLAEEFPHVDVIISRRAPWAVSFGEDAEAGERLMRAMLEALRGLSVDRVKSADQRLTFIKKVIAEASADHVTPPGAETQSASGGAPTPAATSSKPGPSGSNAGGYSGNSGSGGEWRPPAGGSGHRPLPAGATPPTTTVPGGKRPKKPDHERATLASKALPNGIHVSGKRLKQVYAEALNIPVDTQRNASAMMIRLFLELSAEAYCKGFIPLPHKHRDKADWSARGIRLEEKIKAVLYHLDPDETDRTLDHAREGVKADPAFAHTVERVHAFMHDPERVINPKELILIWDRWFGLMRAIHARLDEKK